MLYYFRVAHGNFGDALNPWLWQRLAPEVCDSDPARRFLAIGTILSRRVPAEPVKVVFGSGSSGGPPPLIDDQWFIYGVRGPLTAARLKLDPALALTDPAILVRRIHFPAQKKIHPVSFMPHHQSTGEADWGNLCARAGIHCIDPHNDVEQVLREIQQTELLLAEAMHGAIVADALRVPWIPVRLYGHFKEFKWRDWMESIQVPFRLASIPPIYQRKAVSGKSLAQAFKKIAASTGLGKAKWRHFPLTASTERETSESLRAFEKVAATQTPCLSTDQTIERLDARLFETLGQIRQDWLRRRFHPPYRTSR